MTITDVLNFRLPPLYVIHFITHRCNLFCEFCCDGHNREQRDELSTDEVLRFYSRLRAAQLSITGGEPSLRTDLAEVLHAALSSSVLSVSLNTNGTLPARLETLLDSALRISVRRKLKVNISIDSFRDTHDRMRGRAGAFDAAWESCERTLRLQERYPGLSLRVNTVVTHDNVSEVLEFRQFVRFRMKGIADHVFSLHRTAPGEVVDPELLQVYREVTRQLVSERGLLPKQALLKKLHTRMYDQIATLAEGAESDFRCPAGGALVEVTSRGEVLGCEVLPKEQALLGHLSDHDWRLAPILAGERARAFRARIAREHCQCTFECAHISAATLSLVRPELASWRGVAGRH